MDEELREELRKLTEKRKALLEREKAKGGSTPPVFYKIEHDRTPLLHRVRCSRLFALPEAVRNHLGGKSP